MARPLVGSQVAFAASANIQVHIFVVIEQFSSSSEGTVVNTVYISDQEIDYNYDGTVRHFQDFLHDPGIYERSIPHVTHPDSGDALYKDLHSFSLRNGPYVDQGDGTEYSSLINYLSVEEIEGSRVTISELLVDPKLGSMDLSNLAAQEQTCVYRGRVASVSNVTQNTFTLLCIEDLPEPSNVYVHELTGTTTVVSGDGPKGFTDESYVGEPLPWNNTSVEALSREMFGLVTPIAGTLATQLSEDSIEGFELLLSGQPGSRRTIAKATSGINPIAVHHVDIMEIVVDKGPGSTGAGEHAIGKYDLGWDAMSGGQDGSLLPNVFLWHNPEATLVDDGSTFTFHKITGSEQEAGVLVCRVSGLPSTGQKVIRWRVHWDHLDTRWHGSGQDLIMAMRIEVPPVVAAKLGFAPTQPSHGTSDAAAIPEMIFRGVAANQFDVDVGFTRWYEVSSIEDVFPSDFHAVFDVGADDWDGLRLILWLNWPQDVEGGLNTQSIVADTSFGDGTSVPFSIEMEMSRDETDDWDMLIGKEVIGFDVAVDTDGLVAITSIARGKYGTKAVEHYLGEPCTLLKPTHPDTDFFVWVASMGALTGMGDSASKGPWLQNPQNGRLFWQLGNYNIIEDTGTGSTFQSVRDLLPDPFGTVFMDEEQLRNALLSTFGFHGSADPVAGQADNFVAFAEIVSVDMTVSSYPAVAPAQAYLPGWLTTQTNGMALFGAKKTTSPPFIKNDIGYEESTSVIQAPQAYFPVDSLSTGPNSSISRWRVIVEYGIVGWNISSTLVEVAVVVYPGFNQGVNFGLPAGNDPIIAEISNTYSVAALDPKVSVVTDWFTVPTAGGNEKFLIDFYIGQSDGSGLPTDLIGNAAWKGFRVLVFADPVAGQFQNQSDFDFIVTQKSVRVEFEFNAGDVSQIGNLVQETGAGVSFTDVSGPGGIKMFTAVGGQDYTGLTDYAAKYQNKGQAINALRFYLQERCGVASSQIDDASFNAAFDNELESINTGGSPAGVDVDMVYMEHELGENFRDYMSRFGFEIMSQIIFQHRQTEDVLFWHMPHDPSTTQLDGLVFEYPTPTNTITEFESATENFKPSSDVFTHWKFFWSQRAEGRINGNLTRQRQAFGQVAVAAPVDDFNPAVNDTFLTDTITARNRYGIRVAPDQFFIARKSTGTQEDQVIVRKLARYYIRESIRMPISIVDLVGVPWTEAYDIEIFDTFFLTLPWWDVQKVMRVIGFERDFKHQLTSITAVEVEVA